MDHLIRMEGSCGLVRLCGAKNTQTAQSEITPADSATEGSANSAVRGLRVLIGRPSVRQVRGSPTPHTTGRRSPLVRPGFDVDPTSTQLQQAQKLPPPKTPVQWAAQHRTCTACALLVWAILVCCQGLQNILIEFAQTGQFGFRDSARNVLFRNEWFHVCESVVPV